MKRALRVRKDRGFYLVEFHTPQGWHLIHGLVSGTPSVFATRSEADEFQAGCRAGRDPKTYLDEFDPEA